MSLSICNGLATVSDKSAETHSIEKRGLFYPWLLYSLNAATGEFKHKIRFFCAIFKIGFIGILVAIAIPIKDLPEGLSQHVFVSYNFEANYNMPNIPSDSVPGPPYVRWKLGSTYENMSVNPNGDNSPDDVIAREFKQNVAVTKLEPVEDEVTETTTEYAEHKETKRSLTDSFDLTRKGVYRILESRIAS